MCDDLKQAAVEEGQWNEKRRLSSEVGISEIMRLLTAGAGSARRGEEGGGGGRGAAV